MPIYDDQKERVNTGDLGRITGINPVEQAEMERAAYRGAAEDIAAREGAVDQDEGQSDGQEGNQGGDQKKLSGSELQNAESSKDAPAKPSSPGGGLLQSVRSRVSGAVKNKVFVGAAIGGGVSIGAIVILLIFALGMFKIPNFGEHIASYQFARVTRDFARNAKSINATKMAVDSADNGVYDRLKTKYTASAAGQAQGKVKESWEKLDKYRPNKVIANMQRDEKMRFNYTDQTLLRPNGRLASVLVGEKTIKVAEPTLGSRLIPGVKFARDVSFSREIAEPLTKSLAAEDIGPIIRGQIGRSIRQQLGISLIAWHIGKYQGKTTDEAKIQMQKDAREKIKAGSSVRNPKIFTEKINDTAEKANAAEEAALNDPKQAAAQIANPNELPDGVVQVLDESFTAAGMKEAVAGIIGGFTKLINPIYAIATPLCLIYEGSLVNSGPTINEQSVQAQRAFYLVQSGASQVKDGYQAQGNAVGALGWKLGDIEQSNPEIRASGQAVDTTKSFSTQSSPTGSFSIADAIIPAPFDALFNNAAKTCPAFTNIWVGLGLGAANIAVVIASFGSAAAPEAATEVAATVAVKGITSRILEKIVASKTLASTIAKDTVKQGAIIAGGTFLAKMIVLSQMGSQQSPLAVGVPFANQADNGGNQHAQTIERQALYGRPLTQREVAMNNVADQHYLASQTSSKSFTARYFAPDNPDSLITRVASITSRRLGAQSFGAMFNIGSSILNPVHAFSSAISSIGTSKVGAATADTYNYGNVQFGMSGEEAAKIDINSETNQPNDPTYSILENRLILDQSGKEDEITAKYGPCFDPAKQIGDLLTEETGEGGSDKYYIVRDKNGNVDPSQGLCSQRNTGLSNSEYGDLVFRWRVDHMYSAGLNQLLESQDPTETDSPAATPAPTAPPSGGVVIGDTQNLTCAAGTDAGVADGYANKVLYKIRLCTIQGRQVNAQYSSNFDNLFKAAKADGVRVTSGSGFRTMDEQEYLYNCYVTKSCNAGREAAVPGTSNHQMGLAMDFHCAGTLMTGSDPCFAWMKANAAAFGFKNLPSEAWHWSYDGS